MEKLRVIAVFDVGKTNKKLLLIDEQYRIVFERSARFAEIRDEDGDPCEDLEALKTSLFDCLHEIFSMKQFEVRAVNFSSYGASLVYIDEDGQALTPLYNYLKPFPAYLKSKFYETYGGEERMSEETASPVLESLNSGLQLYRLKHQQPGIFDRVKTALHLPQYLSFLLTGKVTSDMTSIGCHTHLWDFRQNFYHRWVAEEGVLEKLAPVVPCDQVIAATFEGNSFVAGTGLHDSSAALIPYLVQFNEPFLLISTGTWCITLNPFNDTALTQDELKNDCLCYLQYKEQKVKASRLFSGNEHEVQVKRLAAHFNEDPLKYRQVDFDREVVSQLLVRGQSLDDSIRSSISDCPFRNRDLSTFETYTIAYHQLMIDLVRQQYHSSMLVLKDGGILKIFVDGGFSANTVFMNLLATFFHHYEAYAASVPQGTAIGTAMTIHEAWNDRPLPRTTVQLCRYAADIGLISRLLSTVG